MLYLTNKSISFIIFSEDDIAKIIQNLDSNKMHGHDDTNIPVLNIYGPAIFKHLAIIFKQCANTDAFPSEWKQGNIVTILKKGDKQTLRNFRLVSILPICRKVLARLMFNEMFTFFIENKLISSNHSGFKPGDSSVNQLVFIKHEIYKSFDEGREVWGVFLDILKAFEKMWHDGISFKLVQNGISWNLLNFLC